MSSRSDPEAPARNDEQTPLLRDQHIETEQVGNNESEIVPAPTPEKRTRSWYAWRIFWTILVIVVLAVFIKGWIDSDETEFDLKKALKRALGGGLSGAAAMVLQVLLLMPLRTIMNYQYRHGTSFTIATKTLYTEGGIRRYYQGIAPALFQGPISRFGDTAANAGILALLQSNPYLKDLPSPIKTIFASLCAAAFRMILTPIDTLKTTLQAQGARGTALLRRRIKTNGIGSLWWGAFATAAATFVGHYPWFATYNYLSEVITEPSRHSLVWWLLRLAFIGFCASIVSDSISNSLRVVKTYRQVNDTKISYSEAARAVVVQDGVFGLLGRGLKTRILANGLQGILFSILWKLFLDFKYKDVNIKLTTTRDDAAFRVAVDSLSVCVYKSHVVAVKSGKIIVVECWSFAPPRIPWLQFLSCVGIPHLIVDTGPKLIGNSIIPTRGVKDFISSTEFGKSWQRWSFRDGEYAATEEKELSLYRHLLRRLNVAKRLSHLYDPTTLGLIPDMAVHFGREHCPKSVAWVAVPVPGTSIPAGDVDKDDVLSAKASLNKTTSIGYAVNTSTDNEKFRAVAILKGLILAGEGLVVYPRISNKLPEVRVG
ncbi:hypothetical protein HG531_004637 [Fusarium graminearum]|nr:hypothetical protein HG531_004637 [Fusarium graminearum]